MKIRDNPWLNIRAGGCDAQILLHQLHGHVLITRPIYLASILRSGHTVQENEAQCYRQYPIHEFLY